MATPREMANRYLGKGIAFPINVTDAGGTAVSEGSDRINQSILQIIGTKLGERIMRRDFGCVGADLVFEVGGPAIQNRLEAAFLNALRTWEPRLKVTDLQVLEDPDDESVVFVQIYWTKLDTLQEGNLVFPFYLTGAQDTGTA